MPSSDNDDHEWETELKYIPVKTEVEEEAFLPPQDVLEDDPFLNGFDNERHVGSEESSDWEEEKKEVSRRKGKRKNENIPSGRNRRAKIPEETGTKKGRLTKEERIDKNLNEKKRTLKCLVREEDGESKRKAEETSKRKGRSRISTESNVKKTNTQRQRTKRAQMTPKEKEKKREVDRKRKQEVRRLQKLQKEEKRFQGGEAKVNSDSQTPSRLRPRRQPIVKDEPASEADSDYDYEVPEANAKKPRSKRKPKSNDKNDVTLTRTIRRRLQIEQMSEEERQAVKLKWRDEARKRRAQQKQSMTPEEREEFLTRQRERKKEERRKKKEQMEKEGILPPKRNRKPLTADQKREQSQRAAIWRIQHRANMTDEERVTYRMRRYMYKVSRLGRMTDEEKEVSKEKERAYRREYLKRKRAEKRKLKREAKQKVAMSHCDTLVTQEEKRQRTKELQKQRRKNLTKEQRLKRNEGLRNYYYRKMEEIRKDPEKLEKWREKVREGNQRKILKSLETGIPYKKRKGGGAVVRKKVFNWKRKEEETEDEKKERLLMSVKMSQKRQAVKKRLEIQKMLASGKSMDEIRDTVDPPEKREQRLMGARIRKAKYRLKRRLEESGATPEEIEKKVQELDHSYQPTYPFRPFKLRPWELKPVQPNELALLQTTEEDGWKLISPAPISPPEVALSTSISKNEGTRTTAPHIQISRKREKSAKSGTTAAPSTDNQAHETTPTAPSSENQAHATASTTTITQTASSLPSPPPPTHQPPLTRDQECDKKFPTPQVFVIQSNHTMNPTTITITQSNSAYSPEQQQYPQFQTTVYPHQLPQNIPQAYTLQQFFECMAHPGGPAITTAAPPLSHYTQQQVGYQLQIVSPSNHDTFSNTSSHIDYDNSSYGNLSPQPPPSPAGEGDYNDDFVFTRPISTSITSASTYVPGKRGRPPKGTPPKPKLPPSNRPRFGPRGGKPKSSKVIRDVVCDECGNSYNRKYIGEHKSQFHNPTFKNGTCQICGEKFTNARVWYRHLLRTHGDPRRAPSADKPIICDECGLSFVSIKNIQQHKYFSHGDGLKRENFKKCPVCPEEKLFKTTVSLYNHFRAVHPGYRRQTNDCYRCEESFPSEQELCLHVKEQHPHSYFPCEYCQSCRFSRMGLNFHHKKCPKVPKEIKAEIRCKEKERECSGEGDDEGRKSEIWSLDEMSAACEFCGRLLKLTSLSRHYELVHKVIEDSFRCSECKNSKKEFKRRVYWAVHMEEKHERGWKEMTEMIGKLNVKSREGLVINNEVGHRWNQGHDGSGRGRRKKTEGVTNNNRGRGRRKKDESGGKWTGDAKEETEETEAEVENVDWSEGENRDMVVKENRKRRNIVVIAEEDEEPTDKAKYI